MRNLVFAFAALTAAAGMADVIDRPTGYKIGQRMTIRPYVLLFYTYDSNMDQTKHSRSVSSWNISPGVNADYMGENWKVTGGVFYRYHDYTRHTRSLEKHGYGQNLGFDWSDSKGDEKGWTLTFRESFAQILQDDDMTSHGGRGIGRDRKQLNVAGGIERRFNERWHGDVNASYYYLDYDNDSKKYAPMYGWTRWTVGAQAGYAASRWTDFLVAASYQGYTQKNDRDRYGEAGSVRRRHISSDSKGYTLQVGVGTHATERITYRVMGGWSRFEYGDGIDTADGFTYSVSGNWQISDTWNTMLLATSYYQPSERDYGSSIRVDAVSWGIAHSMVRRKLNATFDLAYRHEQHEYTSYSASDYDEDYITARLGLNYIVNRFITVYSNIESQTDITSGSHVKNNSYDYDRFRFTLGLRLTY